MKTKSAIAFLSIMFIFTLLKCGNKPAQASIDCSVTNMIGSSDVPESLGSPTKNDDNGKVYENVVFNGVKGKLTVNDSSGKVTLISWISTESCPDKKDTFKDLLTREYGNPVINGAGLLGTKFKKDTVSCFFGTNDNGSISVMWK